MFKMYELIAEHGHKVLHLPHHCRFNPIELIWSQAKIYYNSRFGMNAVSKHGSDYWKILYVCFFFSDYIAVSWSVT
jgi:hypothetical protein